MYIFDIEFWLLLVSVLLVQANLVSAAKQGRKPFYLKRSEKSRQDLVRRYNMLKDLGKLDKEIAKKARKNASKDHRYVPAKRRTS
jgi:ribosomal RNA-processing protein 36